MRRDDLIAALAIVAIACTAKPPPVRPRPIDPLVQLRTDLAKLFETADLDHALVAVMIQDADTGSVLYEHDAHKLAIPASTAKIVTLSAAAEKLGWDHRYETRLVTSAPIVSGVLKGDLIVIGSGDPSMNDHHGGTRAVFDQLADQLRAAGITAIGGALVGDGRAFGADVIGDGWEWDDLSEGFAAPVGALQIRENMVRVALRPGDTIGAPLVVELPPADAWFEIVNRATTTDATAKPSIRFLRWPGTVHLEISGQAPLGHKKVSKNLAVVRPAELFLREMAAALHQRGIAVRGGTSDVRPEIVVGDMKQLATYRSPPLSELAAVMMKKSQNGYAETFLRTLGATAGDGTATGGAKVVGAILGAWGISPDSYVLRDGSGLSRLGYVTAAMMVSVLRHIHRDPRHRDAFLATLAIAGRDGTLADRMVGTPAEGNVRAKTGTLSSVRALAGFADTRRGKRIAFAILANDFRVPLKDVDKVVEAALVRLIAAPDR